MRVEPIGDARSSDRSGAGDEDDDDVGGVTTTVTVVPFRLDERAVVGAEHDGTVRFEEDHA